jgi:hypothetical protein
LWCNSSISAREADGPGANPGFLTTHTENINKGNRMETNYEESEDSQFEITSKRRKGFPSETRVKRGVQIVHGDKQLTEKLGRNDLCPCGSMRRFEELLHAHRQLRWPVEEVLFSESDRKNTERSKEFSPFGMCLDELFVNQHSIGVNQT